MKHPILKTIPEGYICLTDITIAHNIKNRKNIKVSSEFFNLKRTHNLLFEINKTIENPVCSFIDSKGRRKLYCCDEVKSAFERWLKKIDVSGILISQSNFCFFIKNSFENKYDIKFEYHIEGFRVDILINNNLVIEFDEKYHSSSKEQILKDKLRDEKLKELGYKIIRHNENMCVSNTIKKILEIL